VPEEQKLRGWLAKQLKRKSVSDLLWSILNDQEHVEDALNLGTAAKTDLVEAARLLLPYTDKMEGVVQVPNGKKTRGDKKTSLQKELRLDSYEKERAEALGEYLALRASLHPLVKRFREEVLGGRTLTPRQAYELVDSPAASRFSSRWFEECGVPIMEHSSSFYKRDVAVDGDDEERFFEYEYIFVDPPGKIFTAVLPVSVSYEDLDQLELFAAQRYRANHEYFSARFRDHEYMKIPVYPGSVLDNLHQLSQRLVQDSSHSWEEAQAAWFVLTDEVEAPRAITAHYDDHRGGEFIYGVITLTVEPWVPAETVVKFYQQLQMDMLGHKPRAPSRRNVAVFRFVMEQLRASLSDDGAPRRLSWRWLMERWNSSVQARQEWRYTNENQFSRDYQRGGQAVIIQYGRWDMYMPQKLSIP